MAKKYDYVIVIYNNNCEEIHKNKQQVNKRVKELTQANQQGYYFKYDVINDTMIDNSEVDF